jgi:hypothetical protein
MPKSQSLNCGISYLVESYNPMYGLHLPIYQWLLVIIYKQPLPVLDLRKTMEVSKYVSVNLIGV